MAEIVLGGHRARLVHRDPVERGVAHDLALAVLGAEARDLLGRRLGGGGTGETANRDQDCKGAKDHRAGIYRK